MKILGSKLQSARTSLGLIWSFSPFILFSSTTSRCCTENPPVTNDTMQGGPTPYNEYLIEQRYTHPTHGIDWHRLYPRMEKADRYYDYKTPTATGRYVHGISCGHRLMRALYAPTAADTWPLLEE